MHHISILVFHHYTDIIYGGVRLDGYLIIVVRHGRMATGVTRIHFLIIINIQNDIILITIRG